MKFLTCRFILSHVHKNRIVIIIETEPTTSLNKLVLIEFIYLFPLEVVMSRDLIPITGFGKWILAVVKNALAVYLC